MSQKYGCDVSWERIIIPSGKFIISFKLSREPIISSFFFFEATNLYLVDNLSDSNNSSSFFLSYLLCI